MNHVSRIAFAAVLLLPIAAFGQGNVQPPVQEEPALATAKALAGQFSTAFISAQADNARLTAEVQQLRQRVATLEAEKAKVATPAPAASAPETTKPQ